MTGIRLLRRGEIWLFEPDPAIGHEQMGVRPGVIISSDFFNDGDRELRVIVPLTTRRRVRDLYPYHVELEPEVTGLQLTSYAMCEQIRTVSTHRVYGCRPRGEVSHPGMMAIENRLRNLLDL